jgi:hypothetical protein
MCDDQKGTGGHNQAVEPATSTESEQVAISLSGSPPRAPQLPLCQKGFTKHTSLLACVQMIFPIAASEVVTLCALHVQEKRCHAAFTSSFALHI